MKRVFLATLLVIVACSLAGAQQRDSLKKRLAQTGNNDDRLSWIVTGRDLPNQQTMSEAEIDLAIDRVVQSQRTRNVSEIEVPINYKKLLYYGEEDIRKLVSFSFDIFSGDRDGNYTDAINPKYIYRYGDLFIQSTSNTNRDQLNVYAIIRAYLVIKNKYPEIFDALFVQTSRPQFDQRNIDPKATTFLNANRHYIFTIHENGAKLTPATTTNYGWGGSLGPKAAAGANFMVSDNNNHFIFFNKNTLVNGGTMGTPIYNDADARDRELNYLFDGLIQTFVHERLHNYIGNYQNVHPFLNYIRNDNTLLNGGTTYKYVEEPIVTNTTNRLFARYGGLSREVMTYYTDLFSRTQVDTMKTLPQYKQLISRLRALNGEESNDLQNILYLKIIR